MATHVKSAMYNAPKIRTTLFVEEPFVSLHKIQACIHFKTATSFVDSGKVKSGSGSKDIKLFSCFHLNMSLIPRIVIMCDHRRVLR